MRLFGVGVATSSLHATAAVATKGAIDLGSGETLVAARGKPCATAVDAAVAADGGDIIGGGDVGRGGNDIGAATTL